MSSHTKEALETRLVMLLSLLEDQTQKGLERDTLEALVRKIRDTQALVNQLPEETPAVSEAVRFEDGERDPQDFRHGKPKKWNCRRTVRKSSYQTTKNAHPIPMPWHGKLSKVS